MYFNSKNAFENIVWKIAAILSRPQWVNWVRCTHRSPGLLRYCGLPATTARSKAIFIAFKQPRRLCNLIISAVYYRVSRKRVAIVIFLAYVIITHCWGWCSLKVIISQIAKFIGPTWGPPGSCRPQMGPMLASWTLLSGMFHYRHDKMISCQRNGLCITGPLWRESTCHRWISLA